LHSFCEIKTCIGVNIISVNYKFYEYISSCAMDRYLETINKPKPNKQAAPDKIFPEFIKHLGSLMKKKLLQFYHNIWEGNYSITADWKKVVVIPILKTSKPAEEINSF
jgi:hypothetical protein